MGRLTMWMGASPESRSARGCAGPTRSQPSIDMMTLLIIGSTETRSSGGYVYTPHGYGMKGDSGECA